MVLFGKEKLIAFLVLLGTLTIISIPDNSAIGIFYYNSSEFDKSISYLEKAAKSDPENLETLKKIRSYYIIKGNTKKALEYQDTLVKLRPKNLVYLKELEKLFDWNALSAQKLEVMEKRSKLLKINDQIELHFQIASGYRWLRNYKKADEYFRLAEKTSSYDHLSTIYLYYLSRKKTQQALHIQERMMKIQIPNSRMLRLMASTYEITNKYDLAIKTLISVITHKKNNLFSNETIAQRIESIPINGNDDVKSTLERIIYLFEKLDQVDNAILASLKLYEINPKNINNILNLGTLYIKKNIPMKALAFFSIAEKFSDLDNSILESIFYFYKDLNRLPDALRIINKLINSESNNLDYLERKAETLLEMDQKSESLDIYYQILEIIKTSYNYRHHKTTLIAMNSSTSLPTAPLMLDLSEKNKKILKILEMIIFLNEDLHRSAKALQASEWFLEIDKTNKEMLKKNISLLLVEKMEERAYQKALYYESLFDKDFFIHSFKVNYDFNNKQYANVVAQINQLLNDPKIQELMNNEEYSSLIYMLHDSLWNIKDENAYNDFCNNTIEKAKKKNTFLAIEFDCANNRKQITKAIEIKELQIKNELVPAKKMEFISDLIYMAIDNKLWDKANYYLNQIDYQSLKQSTYLSQNEYYVLSKLESELALYSNNESKELPILENAIANYPNMKNLRTKYIDLCLKYKKLSPAINQLTYLKEHNLFSKENKEQLAYLKEIIANDVIKQSDEFINQKKPLLAINVLKDHLHKDSRNQAIRDKLFYIYVENKNINEALKSIEYARRKNKHNKKDKNLSDKIQYLYEVNKEIQYQNRFFWKIHSDNNYNKFYQYTHNEIEFGKVWSQLGFMSQIHYFRQENLPGKQFYTIDIGPILEKSTYTLYSGLGIVGMDKKSKIIPWKSQVKLSVIPQTYLSLSYNSYIPEYATPLVLQDSYSYRQTLEFFANTSIPDRFSIDYSLTKSSHHFTLGDATSLNHYLFSKYTIFKGIGIAYLGIHASMEHNIHEYTLIFPKKAFINYSLLTYDQYFKTKQQKLQVLLGFGMDPTRQISYGNIFKLSVSYDHPLTKNTFIDILGETNNQLLNGYKSQVFTLSLDLKGYF